MSIQMKLSMSSVDVSHGGLAYRGMNPSELAAAGVPSTDILVGVKDWLKGEIDDHAERLRQVVLTPGSGQAMEYQEARDEAMAAITSPGDATAVKYPMLAASIGIDIDPASNKPATDVLGVARAVIASATAWATLGAGIRGTRLQGKVAIGSAADITAAIAAFDAIAWPVLPG